MDAAKKWHDTHKNAPTYNREHPLQAMTLMYTTGLVQLRMPKDGDCLFSSVSYFKHGDASKSLDIRTKTMYYLSHNRDTIIPGTDDLTLQVAAESELAKHNIPHFDEYIKLMSQVSPPLFFPLFCFLQILSDIHPHVYAPTTLAQQYKFAG